jgi:hypothetical protein
VVGETAGYGTHLPVDQARGIEPEYVKDDDDEGTPVRQGISLFRGMINTSPSRVT